MATVFPTPSASLITWGTDQQKLLENERDSSFVREGCTCQSKLNLLMVASRKLFSMWDIFLKKYGKILGEKKNPVFLLSSS